MKFSLFIETEESQYEVFFDVADPGAASERLRSMIAECFDGVGEQCHDRYDTEVFVGGGNRLGVPRD
jgi:hypothetical protein